jgi:hypothetical protein
LAKDTLLPYEPITIISSVTNVSDAPVPDVKLDINLSTPIKVRIFLDTLRLGCDAYYASYGITPQLWLAPSEVKSKESRFCAEVEGWRVPGGLESLRSGRAEIYLSPFLFADRPERPYNVPFAILPFTVHDIDGDEHSAFNLISSARESLIAGNLNAFRDSLRAVTERLPRSRYTHLANSWLARYWPALDSPTPR